MFVFGLFGLFVLFGCLFWFCLLCFVCFVLFCFVCLLLFVFCLPPRFFFFDSPQGGIPRHADYRSEGGPTQTTATISEHHSTVVPRIMWPSACASPLLSPLLSETLRAIEVEGEDAVAQVGWSQVCRAMVECCF